MNILQALFNTSIGKKVIMAVTGILLVGFIVGHLVGNLQIFSPPEKINEYAHFLQSLGPLLWVIRAILLLVVGLHIWAATVLTLENRKARGDAGYAGQRTLRASYASRTMRFSGIIVLAFIIYHLLHFTTKTAYGPELYTVELHEALVPDVHTMMVLGFQQPLVSIFYLVAIALLSLHLHHGFSSLFQTLGIRSRTWSKVIDRLSLLFCIVYFFGNAAIVGSVLGGFVKPQNPAFVQSKSLVESASALGKEIRSAVNK